MIALIRYLCGYVKIVIIGENPEVFINHLISHNITIWNIMRNGDSFTLCVSIKDYKKIRKIRSCMSLRYRTKILSKCGIVYKIKRSILRPGIYVGLLCFIIINIFLSSFIWQIEVKGLEEISQDEVITVCKEFGLKEGKLKKSVDTYDLSHKIALKVDKIAWVSLNIEGSKLTVNISENENSGNDETAPSSIVAKRDGKIHSIVEKRGTQNVKIGQTVRKGEVLISCVESVGNYVRYVHASGDIIADTQRTFYSEVEKKQIIKVKNYKLESKNVFEFFGLKIPLYLTGANEFDSSYTVDNAIEMFGNKLPISFKTRYFVICDALEKEISKDCAVNIALSKFESELRKDEIICVFKSDVKVKEDKNKYYISLNALCRENIGENTSAHITNY